MCSFLTLVGSWQCGKKQEIANCQFFTNVKPALSAQPEIAGARLCLNTATEINKKAANLVNKMFSKDLAASKFSLKLVKNQIHKE
ncbi:MAG: hypothetical protein K9I74_05605, partial [Bacteroidales bacterium]|nr:hypothetical protein [Bacteroidales bacterium]